MENLIYFDNAATTFPKPHSVAKITESVISSYCANPGRSSHSLAVKAAEQVFTCREKLTDALGGNEENVVFASSATHAINTALKSILKQGDHVLISDIEHNAVYRPIVALAKKGVITYDIYSADRDTKRTLAEISLKIKPSTALICACHHSNICNIVLPIAEIGQMCKQKNILFLVDASQSAGVLQIDVDRQNIDILCAPAHKGLYGIPGCGFAIFSEKVASSGRLDTFIEGGNGVDSKKPFMPDFLPERLEAGTLPLPAIAALCAGLDFIKEVGRVNIAEHEAALCKILRQELSTIKKIRIHSNTCGSILLFSVDGIPSEDFAHLLDKNRICVRAGIHCAPLAHLKLDTPSDGAVRVSFGAFNTKLEVFRFVKACKLILNG